MRQLLESKCKTLRQVFEDYKQTRPLKPTTLAGYDAILFRCLPDWLDLSVDSITKAMILERHKRLSNQNGPRGTGQSAANQVMRLLRSVLTFASYKYDESMPPNPVKVLSGVKAWNKDKRRTDTIKKTDLPAWFAAVQATPNDAYRDYLLCLLFMGLRRCEGVRLAWLSDDAKRQELPVVDLQDGFITITEKYAKNGVRHKIPIPSYILEILKQRHWKYGRLSPWVFPSPQDQSTHISLWAKFDAIEKASGCTWSPHTLRRTFATVARSALTNAGRDGEDGKDLVRRLLNHSGTITDSYVIMDPEELREPMELIAIRILETTCQ